MLPSSFALSLLLTAASRPPAANARVLSPGCAGSPYATVQSALDAAVDGDVVEVCPGTWQERLWISGKRVTLRSRDGAATTTIDAQTWGRALGIGVGSDVTVEGLTFVNGRANSGGNVSCQDSGLEFRDNVLQAGSAGSGGGFASSGCAGIVEGNTFRDNHAGWSGGGAFLLGNDLDFYANEVIANDADSQGGGVYLDGDADLVGNTLRDNHSVKGGGGYVNAGWGVVRDNLVIHNDSDDDGGGVYIQDGGPLIEGNTFELNDTDDEAGGLRVKLSSATVRGNTFLSNHADYRGGAMKVSHGAITMEGNSYTSNSAWVTGGAVLLFESSSTLRHETFLDNTAESGGGIGILEGWGPVVIEDSTFDGNEATEDGGQLYVRLPGQTLTLRRVDLYGGAADDGGAIYATDTDLRFEGLLLDANDASVSGGALYLDAVSGSVVNAVAMWNTAPTGAALTVRNSAALEVTNTMFRANTLGPAVRVAAGAAPHFRYDDFSGNTSNFSGMDSVVGVDGNLSVAPGFVNAAAGDFHLRPTSGLVDHGDPALLDTNGTRSDQGRFGGPQGY